MPANALSVLLLGEDGLVPDIERCNFSCRGVEEVMDLSSIPGEFDLAVIVKQAVGDKETVRLQGLCQEAGVKCNNFLAGSFDPELFERWFTANGFVSKKGSDVNRPSLRQSTAPPEQPPAEAAPSPEAEAQPKSESPKKAPVKRRIPTTAGAKKRAAKQKEPAKEMPKDSDKMTIPEFVDSKWKVIGDDAAPMIAAAKKYFGDEKTESSVQAGVYKRLRQLRGTEVPAASVKSAAKKKAKKAKPSKNGSGSLLERLEQAYVSMSWPLLQEAAEELRRLEGILGNVRREVS